MYRTVLSHAQPELRILWRLDPYPLILIRASLLLAAYELSSTKSASLKRTTRSRWCSPDGNTTSDSNRSRRPAARQEFMSLGDRVVLAIAARRRDHPLFGCPVSRCNRRQDASVHIALADDALDEFVKLVDTGQLYQQTAAIFANADPAVQSRIVEHLKSAKAMSRQTFAKVLYDKGLDVNIPGVEMPSARARQ